MSLKLVSNFPLYECILNSVQLYEDKKIKIMKDILKLQEHK